MFVGTKWNDSFMTSVYAKNHFESLSILFTYHRIENWTLSNTREKVNKWCFNIPNHNKEENNYYYMITKQTERKKKQDDNSVDNERNYRQYLINWRFLYLNSLLMFSIMHSLITNEEKYKNFLTKIFFLSAFCFPISNQLFSMPLRFLLFIWIKLR